MTRLIRPAAIFLLVAGCHPPRRSPTRPRSLYNKGKDAEARQNYEQAYDCYKQAYDLKPKDLQYRSAYERLRFLAAASHVHRGQLLRDAGKLDEALAEFQKAAEIDPSSSIAHAGNQAHAENDRAGEVAPPQSAAHPPNALRKRLEEAQGPVELAADLQRSHHPEAAPKTPK